MKKVLSILFCLAPVAFIGVALAETTVKATRLVMDLAQVAAGVKDVITNTGGTGTKASE